MASGGPRIKSEGDNGGAMQQSLPAYAGTTRYVTFLVIRKRFGQLWCLTRDPAMWLSLDPRSSLEQSTQILNGFNTRKFFLPGRHRERSVAIQNEAA